MRMRFVAVRKIRIILLILILIFVASIITVVSIESYSQWKLLFHRIDRSSLVIFSTLSIMFLIAILIATAFRRLVGKIIVPILILLVSGFLVLPILAMSAFSTSSQYYHFLSPSGEIELIFQEGSTTRSYHVNAYVRENIFFIRPTDFRFSAHATPSEESFFGFMSDRRGERFELIWLDEKSVELTFWGAQDDTLRQTVVINLD